MPSNDTPVFTITDSKLMDRWCRKCRYCSTGKVNLCQNLRAFGVRHLNGGFADYCLVKADVVHLIPHSLPYEIGENTIFLFCQNYAALLDQSNGLNFAVYSLLDTLLAIDFTIIIA